MVPRSPAKITKRNLAQLTLSKPLRKPWQAGGAPGPNTMVSRSPAKITRRILAILTLSKPFINPSGPPPGRGLPASDSDKKSKSASSVPGISSLPADHRGPNGKSSGTHGVPGVPLIPRVRLVVLGSPRGLPNGRRESPGRGTALKAVAEPVDPTRALRVARAGALGRGVSS